ncbi:hypothetical protein ACTSKR_01640 [Chitinibacteraceae bacterium HSL-7]
MTVCFNCRTSVSPSAASCPRCGVHFSYGTWRTPLSGIAPSPDGWGLALLGRHAFRVGALLTPLWLPFFVALVAGRSTDAAGLAILLTPFVLIPGLHVVANIPSWPGGWRFVASIGYAVSAAIAGYWVLATTQRFIWH